jgi:hypothetical protein
MFCENAYYPGGNEKGRLHCKSARKAAEDTMTKDKCPLIYYCRINQRFENTADMFNCQYREKKNDGQ